MKNLVDILAFLGWDFEELDSKAVGECFSLLIGDLSVGRVWLVGDEYLDDVFIGMRFYLTHPVLYIGERLFTVDGVGQDDAHGALVIGLGDGLESLLAGSVPNL